MKSVRRSPVNWAGFRSSKSEPIALSLSGSTPFLPCRIFCLAVFAFAQNVPNLDSGKLTYVSPQGIGRTQQAVNQETVSLNDFKQGNDPDYTMAFERAMKYASVHPGSRILLPCDTSSKVGSFFTLTRGFTIPNATTLEGSSRAACFINYEPSSNPGETPAIISLVGSDSVTLRNF